MGKETKKDYNAIFYFLLGIILFTVVDFGTAGGFKFSYFVKFGYTLLLFYIGYPLVFTVLIFQFKFKDSYLILPMFIAIFLIEVLFTRNPLLMTFPALLYGIPLAILIYFPLTFFPLWILRGETKKHRMAIIILSIIEIIIMLLTAFGN